MNILLRNKLTLILFFAVTACGSNHSYDESEGLKTDTLNTGITLEKRGFKDDSIRKQQELMDLYKRFYSTALLKEGDFSFKTGYSPIDKLKEQFDKDPEVKITLGDYMVFGDCGYQVKSMRNNRNEVLYIMKGDCGDYGFSNGQYYFQKDSLKAVRKFSVILESYYDEPQGLTFSIKEVIYTFKSDHVEIKQRKVIVPDFIRFDYSFKNKPFNITKDSSETLYEEKKKEVLFTLQMKTDE